MVSIQQLRGQHQASFWKTKRFKNCQYQENGRLHWYFQLKLIFWNIQLILHFESQTLAFFDVRVKVSETWKLNQKHICNEWNKYFRILYILMLLDIYLSTLTGRFWFFDLVVKHLNSSQHIYDYIPTRNQALRALF